MPITLLGNRTENVTVGGTTPLLQTANAEVGDVISLGADQRGHEVR